MVRAASRGMESLISNHLAGCSLARIVEEELIAVGIIDHQNPVAPRTLLDRNTPGLEFRTQRVQRGDLGLARFDVQGNEHQPLANLLRPRLRQHHSPPLPPALRPPSPLLPPAYRHPA